ncbi:MAG: iron-sulfur cluster assembly accessory protein [Candidatus Krumholzibacteriia bacterium]
MGTFHDHKGDLHGITVVAEAGDAVYVGRCDTITDQGVVLLDCDRHTEGEDDRSNDEWLQRAARFGVWAKHARLVLPRAEVSAVTPLGDIVRRGATSTRPLAMAADPDLDATAAAADPGPATATATAAPAPAAAGPVVALTDAAQAEVRRLLEAEQRAGQGLRLAVAGGGCSGLVYKVEFDARQEGDVVIPCAGFDVLLDRKSTIYLRGVTLDHRAGLAGRGFVFQNPNASNTCGCGESFAV